MIANRVPEEHRGDALGKYSAIGVGLVALGWLRVDNRPVGEPEPFDTGGLVVHTWPA